MKFLNVLIVHILVFSMNCGGSRALQEQEFTTLKKSNPTLHVPTPFVICLRRGVPDQKGANLIIDHIQSKMDEMTKGQLALDFDEFESSEIYVEYGKALSKLVAELERKDMAEVEIPPLLKDITAKSSNDLSVFVLNIATPRTKAQNAGRAIATIGLGITAGMLTGFTPILPMGISSRLHFVIYSKSKGAVISYEDSEDKDDPTLQEHTYEEVDMLFSRFVDAGQEQ
jgi:hypothetical protein